MALKTPYVTLAEADVYLEGKPWEDLDDEVKNSALFWGAMFIDSEYSCIEFDVDAPPDEIKFANALLAEDYTEGTLIKKGGVKNGRLSKKFVKAGPIETETRYNPGSSETSYQSDVDILLSGICSKRSNTTVTMRL